MNDSSTHSKIVTTLGPATFSTDKLKELASAGADIFRINFSHASEDGEEVIELFNRIRKTCPQIGILCDIQGPKIRVGAFKDPIDLKFGDYYNVYEDDVPGNAEQTCISYKGFLQDIQIGDSIFINDGLIRLDVLKKFKKNGYVKTKVISGGPISSRKGVNIPSGKLSAENPTKKDRKDLKIISKLKPEYVAASFVGKASEVRIIRSILNNLGASKTKIISKIERPIALTNFDEILEISDGVMVARGDLGVEIAAEDVPIRQKEIILKCNKAGKPVIVATQMLESMVKNPVPTRAEVNDVFNAVYDRSDAVMLSGETSVGLWPIKAVANMDKIINRAEEFIPKQNPDAFDSEFPGMYEAAGHAIYEIAEVYKKINFRGKIVIFTRGGKSCRMAAKYRPTFSIFGITDKKNVARGLNLVWGVKPVYMPELNINDQDSESILQYGIEELVKYGFVGRKEHVICSVPSTKSEKRGSIIGMYYVEDILSPEFKESAEFKEYSPKWD